MNASAAGAAIAPPRSLQRVRATRAAAASATASQAASSEPSAVHGTVAERAILKAGYLVDLTLIVSVPAQQLANGRPAPHGIEGERLQLLTIGGTPVAKL